MSRPLCPFVLLPFILMACGTQPEEPVVLPSEAPDMSADASPDVVSQDAPPDMPAPEPFDPDTLFEAGPHKVGYLETQITYMDPQGTARTIPISIWYPAASDTDARPFTYRVAGFVRLRSEIALDAPDPDTSGPFPTAIYSHGSGGEALLAYPYAERFASWGWVVASPGHVGNTALDALNMTLDPFTKVAVNRVQDISATLDAIESDTPPEGLETLTGLADTANTFLFGHSFGAFTTLATAGADVTYDRLESTFCSANPLDPNCVYLRDPLVKARIEAGYGDPRIGAIGPQAPALVAGFSPGELGAFELPTMLQTGRRDKTTTQQAEAVPAWMGLDGPDDIWVEIPDGGHYTFISVCEDLGPDLIAMFRSDAPEDGCDETFVPPSEAIPVLRAYLLAFAKLHILGEEALEQVLTGPPLDPRFEITTR